jgi:hypothetical protein
MQAYFAARRMGFFGPQIVQPIPAILTSENVTVEELAQRFKSLGQ